MIKNFYKLVSIGSSTLVLSLMCCLSSESFAMEDKNNTNNSVKKNSTKRNLSKKGSQEEISVTVGLVKNTWTKEEYKEIAKAYNVTADYLQSVQEDLQKKGPEGNQLGLSKSDKTHFKNSKTLQDCFEQLSQQDDKKTKDNLGSVDIHK